MSRAVAPDSLLFPQSRGQRLAKHDPHVLHRVVQIHVEIPLGLHLQIKQPVPGEQVQHVVKERNPRLHLGRTLPIQSKRDGNLRLAGLAELLGLPFALTHDSRVSTESAWASSRSNLASNPTVRADFRTAAAPYSTTLTRFTKSSTRRPAKARPAPPVGRV